MNEPFRSIGHAIEVAQAGGTATVDVLICEGIYNENLKVVDVPVSLHGGYDCGNWERTGGRPQVKPTLGVVLRIENVTGPMKLTKLTLESADATTPGISSEAVQVIGSTGVSIDYCSIISGLGANGTSGATQTQSWSTQPTMGNNGDSLEVGANDSSVACHDTVMFKDGDLDGFNDVGGDETLSRCTTARTGGASTVQTCPNPAGVSPLAVWGGKGGPGAMKPNASSPIAAGVGAIGAPSTVMAATEPGGAGSAFGSISAKGYVNSNAGGDGKYGQPGVAGKGGDGGGSCMLRIGNVDSDTILYSSSDYIGYTCSASVAWGGTTTNGWASYAGTQGTVHRNVVMLPGTGGGAGGTPGCGGYGGFGGKGGGASIALFVLDSEVSLSWSDVTAGNGGKGGNASDGAAGQAGGVGGKAGAVRPTGSIKLPTWNGTTLITEANLKGQDGTGGGQGQRGSAGGPGGGGPSIAILWDGATSPVYDTTVTLKFGSGGIGGTPITGASASAGAASDFTSVESASSK